MATSDTEFKILIEDIVKSKGYHVYRKWKSKPKKTHELFDSLNAKIEEGKIKVNKSLNEEIKKEDYEPFKQLSFDFDS